MLTWQPWLPVKASDVVGPAEPARWPPLWSDEFFRAVFGPPGPVRIPEPAFSAAAILDEAERHASTRANVLDRWACACGQGGRIRDAACRGCGEPRP